MNPIEWRPIAGFEDRYAVSSAGEIKNIETGYVLQNRIKNNGYVACHLYRKRKVRATTVHRLVAIAFLGEERGKEVNHRNGIKTDNRVENLEWVTQSENRFHAVKVLKQCTMILKCVDLSSGAETVFTSLQEAGRAGFTLDAIRRCLSGVSDQHAGRRWEIVEDNRPMNPKRVPMLEEQP